MSLASAAIVALSEPAREAIRRLLEAVPDTSAKALIANVLRFALPALQNLSEVDTSINTYFTSHMDSTGDAVDLALGEVRSTAFKRVRALIGFLASRGVLALDEGKDRESLDDFRDSVELLPEDFGIFEERATPTHEPPSPLAGVDEVDIEAAFDTIAPEAGQASVRVRLGEMNKQLDVLGHALLDQLNTSEALIDQARKAGNLEAVIRELDVGRESLTEGLFELLNTIFELFPGTYERSALLPGYRDSLQKALLVRRGVRDLSRAVSAANDRLQNEALPVDLREDTYLSLVDVLQHFRVGEVFQAMRPPDRWEVSNLHEELRRAKFSGAAMVAEGLSRYLESLVVVVNQREVLVQHDEGIAREIRESLTVARSVLLVSSAGAKRLVLEALEAAGKLYGRNAALDAKVRAWRQHPPDMEGADEVERIITSLEELL
jgi:hypothetical protein